MPIYKVYTIGQTWSGPKMSAAACYVNVLMLGKNLCDLYSEPFFGFCEYLLVGCLFLFFSDQQKLLSSDLTVTDIYVGKTHDIPSLKHE